MQETVYKGLFSDHGCSTPPTDNSKTTTHDPFMMNKDSIEREDPSYASSTVTLGQDTESASTYSNEQHDGTYRQSSSAAEASSSTVMPDNRVTDSVWVKGSPYTSNKVLTNTDVGEAGSPNGSTTTLTTFEGKQEAQAGETQEVLSRDCPYQMHYQRRISYERGRHFGFIKSVDRDRTDLSYHEKVTSLGQTEEESNKSYIEDNITPLTNVFSQATQKVDVKQRNQAWKEMVSGLEEQTARNPVPKGLLITVTREDNEMKTPRFFRKGH